MCTEATIGIVRGTADTNSIFHVTTVFQNETGITWTAWLIQWDAPFVPEPTPLADVVYAGGSKLTDATYNIGAPAEPGIVLTGDPVLPGEAFTLNLDVYVGEGGFCDRLDMTPIIPEPATIAFLTVGGLIVFMRRKP